MVENNISIVKERKGYTRKQRRLIFYVLVFALPLLQFLLFYLYVNFNSIIIAFQKKTPKETIGYDISFTWGHFANAFESFFSAEFAKMLWNSLQLLFGQLVIVTPLALLFSYYIAKGKPGSSFFRIMLYLPQVLSVVVLGLLYQEFHRNIWGKLG